MRIIEVGGGVDLCPAPLWIPAYAGMTADIAGMTVDYAGLMIVFAGMTANIVGMTVDYAGLMVVFAGMTLIGGMTLNSGYGT